MKDIEGYEGLYAVTEDGRVWSYPKKWMRKNGRISHHQGKWMKPGVHPLGYQQLKLVGPRIWKTSVHRLVALTFIENPRKVDYVNHKNCNPRDNRVENLEWCTHQENIRHASVNGKMKVGMRVFGAKLTRKQRASIRSLYKSGRTQVSLAPQFGVTQSQISRIITGDKKTKFWL